MNKFYTHAYIIGFQKNGGAQLSFYKEAITHAKIASKATVYFFVSGNLSLFNKSRVPENFIILEHKSKSKFNFLRLLKYSYFLFKHLLKLRLKSDFLSINYTTPAISLISVTFGNILFVNEKRYRVGGLLFNLRHRYLIDFIASLLGYIIDFYITLFSNSITFVCNSNKEFYKSSYLHIKNKKLSIIYSPCCDKSLLSKSSNNKDVVYQSLAKIINFDASKQKLILTIVNDKYRKGFPIFYELADYFSFRKDLIFVHLGARSINESKVLKNNLIAVPHTNYISEWINASCITTLFSTYPEGLPQVIAQSLALSVPVLTFQHSGINDLVLNYFNGRIIDNRSSIKKIGLTLEEMLELEKFINYKKNTKLSSQFIYQRHSMKRVESDLYKLFNKQI